MSEANLLKMNLEYWIAWRYLVTKRKEKFLGLISIIAILGVVVGVAALMVVIAVMSGFSQDLRDKIVGNYSHITITAESGIEDEEALIGQLRSISQIRGISVFIDGQALVRTSQRLFGVKVRGIDPKTISQVNKIEEYLIEGDVLNLDSQGAVVGKELARFLGLQLADRLSLQASKEKIYDLKVDGIFSSGMYEYDSELVFLHINQAKQMFKLRNASGIAITLNNLDKTALVKDEIQRILGYNYYVRTWIEANQNFFAALKLEKVTMFIILSLIVLVAAFNIASTLIVMVVQKTRDIGILKALGMTRRRIRRIFAYEGLTIGIIGITLGAWLGWLICFLLKRYQFIKLPADIYYLDHLPVSLSLWPDVFLIIIAALIITVLSTIYPALRAGRLRPVEALRYE